VLQQLQAFGLIDNNLSTSQLRLTLNPTDADAVTRPFSDEYASGVSARALGDGKRSLVRRGSSALGERQLQLT